jgi:electron transfer flavoprotein beta subunit
MKIAVCVKVSPDTAQLKADPRSGAPRLAEAPRRIGTFEEHALEEAVRLKEAHGGRVICISLVAEAPPPEVILRVLAMGADEVCLIEDPSAKQADSLATARVVAAALQKVGNLDIVFCGEGSLDDYSRQVGPRLAETLGIPALTHVVRLEHRDGGLTAHRALEDRTVVVATPTPVLISVGQEINQPRFPTVLQIMSASSKPTTTWRLIDLGFGEGDTVAAMCGVTTLQVFAPSDQRQRIPIAGNSATEVAQELARLLASHGLLRVQ